MPDNGGVYLVPAFAGLGAPHWDPFARGTIVGITRGTTAAHIARAALESIAFQVADLLDAMAADAGIALTELRVDGGAAANNTLMQIQADLLGVPGRAAGGHRNDGARRRVSRRPRRRLLEHRSTRSPANGAVDRRFEPHMAAAAGALRERWSAAVERAKGWEPSEIRANGVSIPTVMTDC